MIFSVWVSPSVRCMDAPHLPQHLGNTLTLVATQSVVPLFYLHGDNRNTACWHVKALLQISECSDHVLITASNVDHLFFLPPNKISQIMVNGQSYRSVFFKKKKNALSEFMGFETNKYWLIYIFSDAHIDIMKWPPTTRCIKWSHQCNTEHD